MKEKRIKRKKENEFLNTVVYVREGIEENNRRKIRHSCIYS